jgi:hypothetical protein
VRGGDDGGRSMKKTGIVFKDFSETKGSWRWIIRKPKHGSVNKI